MHCNFQDTNLTLANFSNCKLDYSNLRNTWITELNLINSSLNYIKFNNKVNFNTFDVNKLNSGVNPLFIRYIKRKVFLKNYKSKNGWNKFKYCIWLVISDCGNSFFRWAFTSIVISLLFGLLYSNIPEALKITSERNLTPFTYYYYSIVTFTTLGFGDIVPNGLGGEILVTIEVVFGYIMLGGLISIFANKIIIND